MARSIPVDLVILCMLFGAGWGLFIDYLVIGKPLRQWPLATHMERAMVACIPVTCAIFAVAFALAMENCPRSAAAARLVAARTRTRPARIAPIATAPPPQANTQNTDLEAQIIGKNSNAVARGDHFTPQPPAYTATASETPQAPPPTYSPCGRP
ncbi:hypothetical protein N7G274_005496 [Stereocaulon virgatum]|uniref:Uncharacterized protein n=1 Tax=Stereocaulon virgatum TaxID=373712 RepID=A0ABR4A719_9LECA